jgi:hypothetical protein
LRHGALISCKEAPYAPGPRKARDQLSALSFLPFEFWQQCASGLLFPIGYSLFLIPVFLVPCSLVPLFPAFSPAGNGSEDQQRLFPGCNRFGQLRVWRRERPVLRAGKEA